jgi:4-amino-4-deoxy-L-arabinose transferase-like glycosyltransferase
MARPLSGTTGVLLSLGNFASSPFFLACGTLVLMDVRLALFALPSVWTFASMWESPGLKRSLLFGFCLGGAFLSKFSSLLLLPALVLLALWFALQWAPHSPNHPRLGFRFRLLGLMASLAIVYITYEIIFWGTDVSWLLSSELSNPSTQFKRCRLRQT